MRKNFYKARKTLLFLFVVVAFTATSKKLTAQVTVSGPQCIIPGITYQYIINGNWNAFSTIKVCLRGGKLASGERCTSDNERPTSVFVIWNDTSFRKLDVTSSLGNTSLVTQATTNLKGGGINEGDRVKLYDSTITSYTFHCGVAKGGSCVPSYSYQWQRSDDGLNWTNISNATGKDLQFLERIIVNTFFRRVTTETNSNTVVYSDTGILAVPF
jgi:hypothetical protein